MLPIDFVKVSQWRYYRPFTYLMVGGSGVLINYFLFITLHDLFLKSIFIAVLVCNIVVMIWTYTLNLYFTFRDLVEKSSEINFFDRSRVLKFFFQSITYMVLDFLFSKIVIDYLDFQPVLGKLIALALLVPASYFVQRFWVFAR